MNKSFLNKIKKAAVSVNISRRQLAFQAKLSPGVIYNIESGMIPSAQSCARLLDALCLRVDTKKISTYLNTLRNKLNISLPKLAARTSVGYGTLYRIEQGFAVSTKLYCIIAKELDMPLEDFIEWPGGKNKSVNTEDDVAEQRGTHV